MPGTKWSTSFIKRTATGTQEGEFTCIVLRGEVVHAKDGELYYYKDDETEEQGIFSIVIQGDEIRPFFTVILNICWSRLLKALVHLVHKSQKKLSKGHDDQI